MNIVRYYNLTFVFRQYPLYGDVKSAKQRHNERVFPDNVYR